MASALRKLNGFAFATLAFVHLVDHRHHAAVAPPGGFKCCRRVGELLGLVKRFGPLPKRFGLAPGLRGPCGTIDFSGGVPECLHRRSRSVDLFGGATLGFVLRHHRVRRGREVRDFFCSLRRRPEFRKLAQQRQAGRGIVFFQRTLRPFDQVAHQLLATSGPFDLLHLRERLASGDELGDFGKDRFK